jgi:hypothetical protein
MSFKMFRLFKLLLLFNMLNYVLIRSEETEEPDDYELQEMRSPAEIQAEFSSDPPVTITATSGGDTLNNSEEVTPSSNIIRTGSLHDVLALEIKEGAAATAEPATEAPAVTEATAITKPPVTPVTKEATQTAASIPAVTKATAITKPPVTPVTREATQAAASIPPTMSVIAVTPPSTPETPIKTNTPTKPPITIPPKKKTVKVVTPLKENKTEIPVIIPEQTKPDNITYNMDLDKFITNVDNLLDLLYHFLAKMRNYSPIRNEFKELSDLFYVVLTPLMPHEDANRECLRRGAKLYEISSQHRLDLLNQMTFNHLPLNASVEEGQTIKIWLDVEQDPDGTLNYQSGAPILTFIYKQTVELENGLPTGHCLYFDWVSNSYVKALCEEEHLTICMIEKTAKVMEEKIFVENINDRIRDVINLKLRKNMKAYLKTHVGKMESGECPSKDTTSLTYALGLDQPVESLRFKEHLDISVYNTLINYLRQDIVTFKGLFQENNLESHLKDALGFARDIKSLYDKGKRTVCFFQKILNDPKPQKALEMWVSEIEQRFNHTVNNTAHLSKAQLEGALLEVKKSFDKIKSETTSHDKVTQLISEAVNNLNKSVYPNFTISQMVSQVVVKVKEYLNGTVNENSTVSTDRIFGDHFLKFSLLDIILASTSVVVATIAIINSIFICLLSPNKVTTLDHDAISLKGRDDLTPLRSRKLGFGPNDVQEYSIHSSIDTMPSPEPEMKRKR